MNTGSEGVCLSVGVDSKEASYLRHVWRGRSQGWRASRSRWCQYLDFRIYISWRHRQSLPGILWWWQPFSRSGMSYKLTSLFSATYYVALPSSACRTPHCCGPCSNRSISPASQASAAKFTAVAHAWMTDSWMPDRCIDLAVHTMQAVPTNATDVIW